MIRKQLYIDDELNRGLKRLAATTGDSEASHVRTALRTYLDRHVQLHDDPLGQLAGLVADSDGPRDVAERHDAYLYDVAEGSSQPDE